MYVCWYSSALKPERFICCRLEVVLLLVVVACFLSFAYLPSNFAGKTAWPMLKLQTFDFLLSAHRHTHSHTDTYMQHTALNRYTLKLLVVAANVLWLNLTLFDLSNFLILCFLFLLLFLSSQAIQAGKQRTIERFQANCFKCFLIALALRLGLARFNRLQCECMCVYGYCFVLFVFCCQLLCKCVADCFAYISCAAAAAGGSATLLFVS